MAVITKHKIFATGKMESGQFIESDENTSVKLKVNSDTLVSGLKESNAPVRFTSQGKIIANEFVEV